MQFTVPDMSCNHCVKAITSEINKLDANAKVEIDLTKKQVVVNNTALTESQVISAINDAGFDNVNK
ncbi:heavy-metal-associated domain-containing protein [Orbaceae bacterium ac157xtp]